MPPPLLPYLEGHMTSLQQYDIGFIKRECPLLVRGPYLEAQEIVNVARHAWMEHRFMIENAATKQSLQREWQALMDHRRQLERMIRRIGATKLLPLNLISTARKHAIQYRWLAARYNSHITEVCMTVQIAEQMKLGAAARDALGPQILVQDETPHNPPDYTFVPYDHIGDPVPDPGKLGRDTILDAMSDYVFEYQDDDEECASDALSVVDAKPVSTQHLGQRPISSMEKPVHHMLLFSLLIHLRDSVAGLFQRWMERGERLRALDIT
ncbi:hypothetical protein PUNSTDRAFT_48209 [Punctularia strigosozonata HHB-11173 SS5]|uniref:uncharacterized protein n=1 Tax=Punctularia strigosozonata (strain HHB-11173) TaxID=741275 RepID=UPI000441757F|nr:uncharacterized protein PUNSTDRAFT_48209 [Punctularia strigosozonata HHB-11173 SS5]EIN13147.1 hypothetical protein PUNSTDRAFT_48209 [Punctularia strigosozonata HHB-11173 SS5]